VIAINASIIGDRPTGLGTYAAGLVGALADLGDRLVVYTSARHGLRPDIAVRRIPSLTRPERGMLGHVVRLVWTQIGLRSLVRRDRPRLLLNLMPEGLLSPIVPQVTMVYDVLPLLFPAEYPRQQHYFRHYVPAVLRRSRAVLTISESSRRDVVRAYPDLPGDRVHVVLSGYDAGRFRPAGADDPQRQPYALFVGNLMPHKNVLRLVDAFAEVAARTPARLVLRGSGRPAYTRAVRARIDRAGLRSRVDFRPYVTADDLAGLYRAARMLVLPSLHEGFGLTALEAMACGTPVIASTTSSLPEVVGDAGLLVDPCDVGGLAGAMLALFGDDQRIAHLRARGPVQAARFSWARTARLVREALEQCAAGAVCPAGT
jgi:glycosyltransferase involved in cell wall biosynthesis